MGFLKKHFSMYSHLPREIYVLAFGKVMTSMGALIWPMLTLIMSEKLGLNGQTIGLYMMIFSLFMVIMIRIQFGDYKKRSNSEMM